MVDIIITVLIIWGIAGAIIGWLAMLLDYEAHRDKAAVLIAAGGPIIWIIGVIIRILEWGSRGYGD